MQASAGHQWQPELPHRGVEATRGPLQHPLVRRQLEALLHPAHVIDQRAMGDANALRAPGRTRGIDDVGQMLRTGTLLRIPVPLRRDVLEQARVVQA